MGYSLSLCNDFRLDYFCHISKRQKYYEQNQFNALTYCLNWTDYQRLSNQCILTPGRNHQFPLITHTLWAIIIDLLQGQNESKKLYMSCFLLILWHFPSVSYFNLPYSFPFLSVLLLSLPHISIWTLFIHKRSVQSERQCFRVNTGLLVEMMCGAAHN